MKKIKVGSDFSGVGAFDQALKRLGIPYHEVFACDMDKFARKTFISNYGHPDYYPENVYDREIPSESLDLYMTSPPCQAFSIAGKRLGKDDKRGILFFNSLDFIQVNKPRFFIFENVKGLLSHDSGRTFQEWINLLGGKSVNGVPTIFPYEDAVPYHIYHAVLNATDFDIPQNRERVFIVGIRDDEDNVFSWPREQVLTKRLRDVLEPEVDGKYYLSQAAVNRLLGRNYSKPKIDPEIAGTINTKNNSPQCSFDSGTTLVSGFGTKIVDENDIAPTIISGGTAPQDKVPCIQVGCVNDRGKLRQVENCSCIDANYFKGVDNHAARTFVVEGYSIRRLTPRECFRLMDFPDTFHWPVSDSQAYKQAGNSICVGVLVGVINGIRRLTQ